MTTFILLVGAIVLFAALGLVAWLRRVVACVDAPPGDDTTTLPARRATVTPIGARRTPAPDAAKDDLRWIGNFRAVPRSQSADEPTFPARPARTPS